MLFALLRASLHKKEIEKSFFTDVSDEEWQKCYRLAAIQGVMALAWDGVRMLPEELLPLPGIKLSWAMGVDAYEKKYCRYCQVANEISGLYARYGIATMALKGVGFSTLYPVPSHREGGDIDIYTYSADKNKMNDEEANHLADKVMEELGVSVNTESYKHSNFYYKGIPIENHKCFLNVKDYCNAVMVDNQLKELMHPQLVSLGNGEIMVPSATFNTLFIAFHAVQHYGSGLALHHLCDWAVLISRFGLHVPDGVKDKRFLNAISALTVLCNTYLGTSVKVVEDDGLAGEMLNEILHPRYSPKTATPNSKVGILIYKIKRMFYEQRLKSRVVDTSLAGRLWDSVLFHLRKPESIFGI